MLSHWCRRLQKLKEPLLERDLLSYLGTAANSQGPASIFKDTSKRQDLINVRFSSTDNACLNQCVNTTYGRTEGESEWYLQDKTIAKDVLPSILKIVPDVRIPVRTTKIRTAFDRSVLKDTLQVLKPLNQMVLFKCKECNTRFPTWHPDFPCPVPKLKVSGHCPIDVHPDDWDSKPTGESDFFNLPYRHVSTLP